MKNIVIAIALAASACTPHVRSTTPPPELLQCGDEPRAPDLPSVDWTDLAAARATQVGRDVSMLGYVLALRSWGGGCAANLAGVKAWKRGVE